MPFLPLCWLLGAISFSQDPGLDFASLNLVSFLRVILVTPWVQRALFLVFASPSAVTPDPIHNTTVLFGTSQPSVLDLLTLWLLNSTYDAASPFSLLPFLSCPLYFLIPFFSLDITSLQSNLCPQTHKYKAGKFLGCLLVKEAS